MDCRVDFLLEDGSLCMDCWVDFITDGLLCIDCFDFFEDGSSYIDCRFLDD